MGLISSTQGHYEFDILVLATGFDALTGALDRLSITGRDGLALKEKWRAGPNTFMGVSVHGFPNLFMITGPQAPFANLPTTIEQDIRWIARCIQAMEKEGHATAEPQNYFDKLDESAEAGFPELQFSRRDGAETAAG